MNLAAYLSRPNGKNPKPLNILFKPASMENALETCSLYNSDCHANRLPMQFPPRLQDGLLSDTELKSFRFSKNI